MIGKKVKVFWPVDESWYTGIVEEFDPNTGEHCLQYADGDTEWVKIGDLSSQQQQSAPSPSGIKARENANLGESSVPSDNAMSPLIPNTRNNRKTGSTGSTMDNVVPSTLSSHQLHNDTDDDATAGTNLLLPPPKIASSKSASPYPYVPPPQSSQMMYSTTGNMMIPPQQFATIGGQQHFMPYQPHYVGAVGGPPPPQLMMTTGGHLQPPPPPHYAMMPPHMYDPSGGMDMMPPGTMMMMGGTGGEMMLLDYPPMLPPLPTGSTSADHHHDMMLKNINNMNGSDANDTVNNNSRGRKSGPKPWTKEEDNMLLTLVQTMQWPMKWTVVAHALQDRTGKQCRERYVNHLNPRLKSSDWAPIEDATIFHLYNTITSHWAKMAKIIPGRTDNGIKNRFHNIRRQYEREDTHRLRLSNVSEYTEEVRHDRLRNFPEHMSGITLQLWDMKRGIGILAAQSILNGSSSNNTVSGLTASFNRNVSSSISSNNSNSKNNSNNSNGTSAGGNTNGTTPQATTNVGQNNRFGPFREVVVATNCENESKVHDANDNDAIDNFLDGSEICVRCGLIVPSIHTGNEICTKTGWCISCVFIPPNICSNLLRETLNLRRCVDTGGNTRSNKTKMATNASTTAQDKETSKEELNELRSMIESFEEFFHPTPGEEWNYSTTTSSNKNNDDSQNVNQNSNSDSAASAEL